MNQRQFVAGIFFTISFLTLSYPSFSQTDSTKFIAKAKEVEYVFADDINTFYPIDTSLKGFQFFNPADPSDGYFSLGNLGSPYYSVIWKPDSIRGFDIGLHTMDRYRLTLESTPFYHNTYSYSELNYALGLRGEQLVNAKVSQRFGERMNVGVEFQRLSSVGTYLNQETGNYNMRFFDWYRSKNNRYNLLSSVAVNWMNANINGGIDPNLNLEDSFFLSKKIVPINLDGASIKWNDAGGFIQQSWDFGKKYEVQIDTSFQKVFQPKSRLTHRFLYQNHVYRFMDEFPDSIYYADFGITIDSSMDTLTNELEYDEFANYLTYSYLGVKSRANDAVIYKPFVFDVTLSHRLFEVYDNSVHRTFSNLDLAFNFENNKRYNHNILYGLNAWYSLIDYNAGDYDLNAHFGIYWHGQGEYLVGVQAKSSSHSYRENETGAHFFNYPYETNLKRIYLEHSNNRNDVKLMLSYNSVNGYVFWNVDAIMFADYSGLDWFLESVNFFQLKISKDFTLGKFHLDNKVVYQSFSNRDVIHLPEFVAHMSWYYENKLFKSAMLLQAGFSGQYNTDFFAPAYSPVIQQFYLQSDVRYHYTPTLDVFVNMRIKRARLFFVLENALQGVYQNIQYGTHLYPTADRTFRGGISWKFYD